MKIILSPAKKMVSDTDSLAPVNVPKHMDQTAEILSFMKSQSKEELKAVWKCNERLPNRTFTDWKLWICTVDLLRQYYPMKESHFSIWHQLCLRIDSLHMYKST